MTEIPSSIKAMARTECACDSCVAGCKHMPGMLAPDDHERIPKELGIDADDNAWRKKHFRASPGALVLIQGKPVRIPTIVPAQTGENEEGPCVFLDKDNLCTIHKFAPYGCAFLDMHMAKANADARVGRALRSIIRDGMQRSSYQELWRMLSDAGKVVGPVWRRREALAAEINKIEGK